MNLKDLGEDALIGFEGRPHNLIGDEIKRVLDNTDPGRTVDVGGHSLGTSLILTAFDNDDSLQDRVHQTYLYNPAMSPLALRKNVTQLYEDDDRVRYFIDLLDPVSVGGIGSKGPKNAVYRTSYHNPLHSHQLTQWGGPDGGLEQHADVQLEKEHLLHKKAELPYDRNHDGVPDAPGDDETIAETADEFVLDFGNDFDSGAWNVYWNE